MADNILSELEAAAGVLLGPPQLVSQEQRTRAEAVFLNLRKTKSPYQVTPVCYRTSNKNNLSTKIYFILDVQTPPGVQ